MANNKFEARIGANTDDFDKGLKKAQGGMSKFGSAIKKAGLALAAAFSINKLVQWGKEFSKIAAEGEGIRQAFGNLNKTGLLDDLRKATRGTVDDIKLMQMAVQADNFKIPLSQLATYFEFAAKRATQTGKSVDYLVDSIVTGVARKSIPIMDNLGISSVELQKEVAKVGDFGKASGNIIARELKSMGEVTDTTSTKTARLSASWANLKEKIGDVINQSPAMQKVLTIMDDMATSISAKIGTIDFSILSKEELGLAWERVKAEQEDVKAKLAQYNYNIDNLTLAEKLGGAKRTNNALIDKELDKYDQLQKDLKEINKYIDERLKKEKDIANTITRVPVSSKITGLTPGSPTTGNEEKDAIAQMFGFGGAKDALKGLQGAPSMPGQMIKEFSDMQIAVMDLSDTFAGFFSDVNLGFQGMIDGVITGLKRLVMELIAKAAFLALLSVITGVPLSGAMFQNILGPGIGSLIKGGALGTGAAKSNIPVGGVMQDQLMASLNGKQIDIIMKRYNG